MSDDLKEKTKRMAEESKKINSMFGELLNEVEEKLGIESPGKREKASKESQDSNVQDGPMSLHERENLETFSSEELLNAKYGETSVHDFSVDEIYAAMRKRSPGPIIQPTSPAGTNNVGDKEELRAQFAATAQPSVPVIRYSDTLDWRAREATDSLAPRPEPGIINVGGTRLSQQEKPLPPPTSTNLYNSTMFTDRRYNPAEYRPSIHVKSRPTSIGNVPSSMTSTSNVNNNADDNNDGSKYNDYDEMIYREKDAINTGTSGAETYSLKHHHPEDVSPPSPFVKNGRWIDSRMTSENESEHRRMAGMSTMHADHVSSLHRLQDYHRSIMQEACDIDHVLEEAKDIMFQAKSMVSKYNSIRAYSTFQQDCD